MILKSAIDKYTGQLRDNHTWMKELTHEDMDELIASLRHGLSCILSYVFIKR